MKLSEHRTAFLVALAVMAGSLVSPAAPSTAEDELKSATVLLFLRHTTWPENPESKAPITVGVLGRTSYAQVLHGFLDGKSVNGRSIRTIELKSVTDPRCCHVIYIASDRSAEIKQALQEIGSAHALTIGEADRFVDNGGAVNLLFVDGHIAFEVGLDALRRAGIDISSKLLRLGQIRGRRE